MPFVALVPLVVVAAVVAAALGVPARRVAAWAGAAIGGLVGLTALSLVVIIGFERGDDDPQGDRSSPPPRVRTVDAVLSPAEDTPFPAPVRPIDRLEDGATRLLRIAVEEAAVLQQCPADAVRPGTCAPGIPTAQESDAEPTVLFQFSRHLGSGTGRTDCAREACVLVAMDESGRPLVATPLVFGRAAARPSLTVAPGRVRPGDAVTVRLRGFPAFATGTVTLCAPGRDGGAPTCGGLAPGVPFRADADGRDQVELAIEEGPVGSSGAQCRRGEPCAVGVVDAPVVVAAQPVAFAGPGGPSIPAERAATGIGGAVILAAAALLVVRRTDWTPPGGDPFRGVDLGSDPFAGIDTSVNDDW